MGMWTKGPNGRSVWREDLADTPQNQQQHGEGRGTWDGHQTQQGPAGPSGGGNSPGGGGVMQRAAESATTPPGYIGVQPSGGTLSPEDQRRQAIYGLRANENLGDWSKRAFSQSAEQYAPGALNPNSFQNPMADSPMARFFSQRYGNVAPSNALIQMLLGGGGGAGVDPTVGLQNTMKGSMQTGAGLGTADNYRQQMGDISGMVNRAMGNDFSGMNDFQQGMSRKLLNDPYSVLQLLTSQLQGTTGGFGLDEMTNMLSDEARATYNDPYGHAADKVGPFMKRALGKLGWAQ